jgi:hypothetical protein
VDFAVGEVEGYVGVEGAIFGIDEGGVDLRNCVSKDEL